MGSNVVNLDGLLASFEELWAPRVVADVNDWAVKVAKVRGEYVWHAHETDELFVVLSGELDIACRGAAEDTVRLARHDVYVVRRGVEHRPSSVDGAVILMIEPAATLSTGDHTGPVPDHITSTAGLRAG